MDFKGGIFLDYLYIFIEAYKLENILKYGIKLSENTSIILKIKDTEKKGFIAYLSPYDSKLFENKDYICLRIKTKNINGIIYNNICKDEDYFEEFTCDIQNYTYGLYEEPIAIVCSSILPENIFLYNNIKDVPLIIQNSKEYFYEKSIYSMLDSGKITLFEIYQILLILCEQKKLLKITNIGNNTKIYTDKNNTQKYTRKKWVKKLLKQKVEYQLRNELYCTEFIPFYLPLFS